MLTARRTMVAATMVSGLAIAGTGLASAASPEIGSASVTSTTPSAVAASQWLATQTVDGVYLYHGFPDWGATADVAIAHAAAGHGSTVGAATLAALRDNSAAATGVDTPEASAAGTAKVALVAAIYGEDASDFGGVDLLATLDSLIVTAGPFTGLYSDGGSDAPSFPNTFTQSYAITAASRLGVGNASTVSFLLDQQCGDGGFRLFLDGDECESDLDSTALAVQALLAAQGAGVGDDAAVSGAVSAASTYLVMNQLADGSYSSSGQWGMVNTNTTGLAAQALRATGAAASADLATDWLEQYQLLCTVVAEDFGAFPYDTAGFDAADSAAAIPAGNRDSYGRATAQAILGLDAPSLAALTNADRPLDGAPLTCASGPATTTTTTTAPATTAPETSAPDTTVAPESATTVVAPTTTAGSDQVTTTAATAVLSGQQPNTSGGSTTYSTNSGTRSLARTGASSTPLIAVGLTLLAVGAASAGVSLRLRRSSN